MSGQFYYQGDRIVGSSFQPTTQGFIDLCDTFYDVKASAFGKAMGSIGYGLGSPNGPGYFNPIFDKRLTAAVFKCDNTISLIGKRAYDHEGQRLITKLAAYGMADEFTRNGVSMVGSQTGFLGLGAGTNQDGLIQDDQYLPVEAFRMPAVDLPFPWSYGLMMQALEGKDDTVEYKSFVNMYAQNYSDEADRTILRPLWCKQPVAANNNIVKRTAETSMQGISRLIASGEEIGKTYNGVEITEDMVSPYGGVNGDFYAYRGKNSASGDAHEKNYIDGNVVDMQGDSLTTAAMRKAYRMAYLGWDSPSPNGKVWIMSHIAQDKLGAITEANKQSYLNSVYVSKGFNGVQAQPGRDTGFVANSYDNIVIIQDPNVSFDYGTLMPSATRMGDIYLLDMNYFWTAVLTPMETWKLNNPATSRDLLEHNLMSSRMNVRISKAISHAKIVNMADDA